MSAGVLILGILFAIFSSVVGYAHCVVREHGLKMPLKTKVRAVYVIRAVYQSGHVEFISFEMDQYALTEDEVLSQIQNKRIEKKPGLPSYGDLHSVRLVYSPKSPEDYWKGFLQQACKDPPEFRPMPIPMQTGRP